MTWFIYAARTSERRLEYIGQTVNAEKRWDAHRKSCAWARACTFSIIGRVTSEARARRIEAKLIRRFRPPRNIHSNPLRDRPGMMPAEDARQIWHGNPALCDMALLEKMPGWSRERAYRHLGRRDRKAIWRRPVVVDGRAQLNAKLMRLCFVMEKRDALAKIKSSNTKEAFSVARAHQKWNGRPKPKK